MRFSAKRFALAALSAYYNYTEIVKTCHLIFKYSKVMKVLMQSDLPLGVRNNAKKYTVTS